MAKGFFRLSLLCVLFSLSSAAHSAPAPAVDCSTLVMNMADCLSYVSEGGTAKKPGGQCCSGLKTVLKTDADCLCEAFKNSAQLGVTLNMTKALGLPAACHVSAPSVSNCHLGSGAAPALSPMALSPSSVAGAPTTFGAHEAAPAPTPGHSASSALKSSLVFVFAISFALFI